MRELSPKEIDLYLFGEEKESELKFRVPEPKPGLSPEEIDSYLFGDEKKAAAGLDAGANWKNYRPPREKPALEWHDTESRMADYLPGRRDEKIDMPKPSGSDAVADWRDYSPGEPGSFDPFNPATYNQILGVGNKYSMRSPQDKTPGKLDIFRELARTSRTYEYLPDEKKREIHTDYFISELADKDFFDLPEERQMEIVDRFHQAQMRRETAPPAAALKMVVPAAHSLFGSGLDLYLRLQKYVPEPVKFFTLGPLNYQLSSKLTKGGGIFLSDEADLQWMAGEADRAARRSVDDLIEEYGDVDVVPSLVSLRLLGDTAQMVGFSGISMGSAILGFFTGGPLAAGALSAVAAYNMDAAQFERMILEAYDAEKMEKTGQHLTFEEQEKILDIHKTNVRKHGAHEALWEAVGNLTTLAAGKVLAKGLLAAGEKLTASGAAKSLWGLAKGAGAMAGGLATEVGSETLTQMEQSRVEAGVLGTDPTGWVESFKEVAPQTALLYFMMGGMGTAAHGIGYVQQSRASEKKVKAQLYQATDELTRLAQEEKLAEVPDEVMEAIEVNAQIIAQANPNDPLAQAAAEDVSKLRKIKAEQRAAQTEAVNAEAQAEREHNERMIREAPTEAMAEDAATARYATEPDQLQKLIANLENMNKRTPAQDAHLEMYRRALERIQQGRTAPEADPAETFLAVVAYEIEAGARSLSQAEELAFSTEARDLGVAEKLLLMVREKQAENLKNLKRRNSRQQQALETYQGQIVQLRQRVGQEEGAEIMMEEVENDSEAQSGIPRAEREGQEPGRAVPEQGEGGGEAQTGGVLQTPGGGAQKEEGLVAETGLAVGPEPSKFPTDLYGKIYEKKAAARNRKSRLRKRGVAAMLQKVKGGWVLLPDPVAQEEIDLVGATPEEAIEPAEPDETAIEPAEPDETAIEPAEPDETAIEPAEPDETAIEPAETTAEPSPPERREEDAEERAPATEAETPAQAETPPPSQAEMSQQAEPGESPVTEEHLLARRPEGEEAIKSPETETEPAEEASKKQDDSTIKEEQSYERPGLLRGHGGETLEGAPPEDVRGTQKEREASPGAPRSGEEDRGGDRQAGLREGTATARGEGDSAADVRAASERGGRAEPGGESRVSAGAGNYRITDDDALEEGGPVAKYDRNIAAIKLLKKIESENRQATPEEQAVLVKYVGWGGMPQAFDTGYYATDAWRRRANQLQELLTDEEYEAARRSTPNAHFSSPEVITSIYRALARMGYDGRGWMLEPSMGTGNFFGLLPEGWEPNLTGVELDSITGRIASQLYQNADVRIKGYQETNLPDGFYDLAVGNVPFGNYKVHDPRYNKLNFPIHDYFFAKTLDKVRPGGLVVFITSSSTMDKKNPRIRRYIADRAELVAAVRLPGSAFKGIANTEVTTDVLFLRKYGPNEKVKEAGWIESRPIKVGRGELRRINSYYHDNPNMMLGELVVDKLHPDRAGLSAPSGQDLAGEFNKIIEQNVPQNIYSKASHPATEAPSTDIMIPAPDEVKEYAYYDKDGKIYQKKNGVEVEVDVSGKEAGRYRRMIKLRSVVRIALRNQLDGKDAKLKGDLERLNKAYDEFVKHHGIIHKPANVNAFKSDPDLGLLLALEKYDSESGKAEKSDFFTRRTVAKYEPVTEAATAEDALSATLFERGVVDMKHMSQLTGMSQNQLVADLAGLIYKDPDGGRYVTADEYLSGNVREKLENARAAAKVEPAYQANVEALEKVQPEDLGPADIDARLGSPWIPDKYVTQFMVDLINTSNYRARFMPQTGHWVVEKGPNSWFNHTKNHREWGTEGASALKMIEDSLNNRITKVYTTDENDKRVLDREASLVAQAKQAEIQEKFTNWLWEDDERAADMVNIYNREFNNTRLRRYDGSHIDKLPGANPSIELRPHQKDAIWRVVRGQNTLLGHTVGSGKTIIIASAAMELRRMGLAKKPIITVPKHLLKQWEAEFMRTYPAANVLVPTEKDFTPAKRAEFMSRITTGDWDAVIVTHDQFAKLPMSRKAQIDFMKEQIQELEYAARAEEEELGKKTKSVKELEKAKERIQTKLEKLLAAGTKDETVTFEELGIDYMFVDEAHKFKNLFFATHMTRVAGVPNTESQRAADMFLKSRYLTRLNRGRGVVFATGTPISNTMAEMFTLQRYLDMDALHKRNIHNFDAWAKAFGEIITGFEVTPTGSGFRINSRFSKFINLPELQQLFRSFADIVLPEDINLPIPKTRDGKPKTVSVDASAQQKRYIESLLYRMKQIQEGRVPPEEDNALKVTTDGRKAALDIRLVLPDAEPNPDNKIARLVDNVVQHYNKGSSNKLTQLIFCDFSKPDKKKWNVYNEVKNLLVERGIPAKEIAFIHDAGTDAKKAELFKKMREGRVRILMGSTSKMGEGVNVQTRLEAIHHLDAPWRPSDIEQRNGRIYRQGNTNEEVSEYRYVTKGSFDAYMWQILESKSRFIGQVMKGDLSVRSAEDIENMALSYAEVKALASGNPMILEKVKVDAELRKVKAQYSGWKNQQFEAKRSAAWHQSQVEAKRGEAEAIKKDIARRNQHPERTDKDFKITLRGKHITNKKNARKELFKIVKEYTRQDVEVPIGNYRGFRLSFVGGFRAEEHNFILVKGEDMDYQITVRPPYAYADDKSAGTAYLAELSRSINGLEHSLERAEKKSADHEKQLREVRNIIGRSFEHEQKMKELEAEAQRMDKEIERVEKEGISPEEREAVEDREAMEREELEESEDKSYSILSRADLGKPGLPKHVVENYLVTAARRFKNPPAYRVVATQDMLPGTPEQKARRPEGIEALYERDHAVITVVAENISSLDRLEAVAVGHETFAHYGVEMFLTREAGGLGIHPDRNIENFYKELFNWLKSNRPAELIDVARTYWDEARGKSDHEVRAALARLRNRNVKVLLSSEWTARRAETGELYTDNVLKRFWNRLVRAIKRALRNMGVKVKMSEAEIRAVAFGGRREVEVGKQPLPAGRVPTRGKWTGRRGAALYAASKGFNYPGKELFDRVAEKYSDWFGDSKLPRVVVWHGTDTLGISELDVAKANSTSLLGRANYTSQDPFDAWNQGHGDILYPVLARGNNPIDLNQRIAKVKAVQWVRDFYDWAAENEVSAIDPFTRVPAEKNIMEYREEGWVTFYDIYREICNQNKWKERVSSPADALNQYIRYTGHDALTWNYWIVTFDNSQTIIPFDEIRDVIRDWQPQSMELRKLKGTMEHLINRGGERYGLRHEKQEGPELPDETLEAEEPSFAQSVGRNRENIPQIPALDVREAGVEGIFGGHNPRRAGQDRGAGSQGRGPGNSRKRGNREGEETAQTGPGLSAPPGSSTPEETYSIKPPDGGPPRPLSAEEIYRLATGKRPARAPSGGDISVFRTPKFADVLEEEGANIPEDRLKEWSEHMEAEMAAFDDEYKTSVISSLPGVVRAWKKRNENVREGKTDLHSFFDLILKSPEHFFQKIPAAWRVFRQGLDRTDNKYHIEQEILTGEIEPGEGESDLLAVLISYRKADKAGFNRLMKAVVASDRNRDPLSPQKLEAMGISQSGIRAWKAYRKIMDNGLNKLTEDARAWIERLEEQGLDLPEVVIEGPNGELTIDLKAALDLMGELKGTYMPRRRQPKRWQIYARPEEGRNLSPRLEYYSTKTMMEARAAQLRAQGYTVTKRRARKIPESVWEDATSVVDYQAVINEALREMRRKSGGGPATLEDLGLSGEWGETADGQRVFVLTGPTPREFTEALKSMGGKFYADMAAPEGSPARQRAWQFVGASKNIETRLAKNLAAAKGSFPGADVQFARVLAEQISDVLRGRGFRSAMISRVEATGTEVTLGYDPDALRSAVVYAKGIAGGLAKKDYARNVIRAWTGTDISYNEWAEGRKEPEYEDYLEFVASRRIDPAEQPNAHEAIKLFVTDTLRNDEQIDRIAGALKGLAVLKYLGFRVFSAPAVNMTALGTTVPAAMHHYGGLNIRSAPRLIGDAIARYAAYKWSERLSAADQWVFEQIESHGWHQSQYNREALTALKGQIGRSWAAFTDASMWAFGMSEQINRVSTIAGAYKGLSERRRAMGDDAFISEISGRLEAGPRSDFLERIEDAGGLTDEAVLYVAKHISDMAHGIYGKESYPHWARGRNWALQVPRSFYVFQKFPHNYLQNLARYGAKKDSKALLYALLSTGVFGGLTAVPGATLALMAAGAILGVDDPEEELYDWLAKTFGPAAGRFGRFGLPGTPEHGVTLKGSLKVWYDMPSTLWDIGGAPASVIEDFVTAGGFASRHNLYKAMEYALPNAGAKVLRAVREHKEGMTTRTGGLRYHGIEPIRPDPEDTILRVMGFTPSRLAAMTEAEWHKTKVELKYKEWRNEIYDLYARRMVIDPAGGKADPEAQAEVLMAITAYNNQVERRNAPVNRITQQSLHQAMMRRFRAPSKERTTGGGPLPALESPYSGAVMADARDLVERIQDRVQKRRAKRALQRMEESYLDLNLLGGVTPEQGGFTPLRWGKSDGDPYSSRSDRHLREKRRRLRRMGFRVSVVQESGGWVIEAETAPERGGLEKIRDRKRREFEAAAEELKNLTQSSRKAQKEE